VLDDDLLSELLCEAALHDSRDDVGAASRRIGHDEAHRFRRPVLRASRHRGQQAEHEKGCLFHRVLEFEVNSLVAFSDSNSTVSASWTLAYSLSSMVTILRTSAASPALATATSAAQDRLSAMAPTLALHDLSECATRAISRASPAPAARFSSSTSL